MNYDLVVEELLNEHEQVDEAVIPALMTAASVIRVAAWLAPVAGAIITYYKWLPESWTNMAKESYWYMAISIFDITGIMSWPYVQMALERWEQDPEDEWNNIFLVICYLATLPSYSGIGLAAKFSIFLLKKLGAISGKASGKIGGAVIRIYQTFLRFGGKTISSRPGLIKQLHERLVVAYTKNLPTGHNMGVIMRQIMTKSMGIKFSDKVLMNIAKKKGITLDPKLFKGVSALKMSLGAKALKAGAVVAKTAATLAKPLAVAGTVFNTTSGKDAFSQLMKNRRNLATPASGIRAVPEFGKIGAKTPAIH